MANPKRPPSREVRRLREELRQLIDRWETVIQHGAVLEGELAQGLAQLRESRAAEMLKTIPVTQAEHPDGPSAPPPWKRRASIPWARCLPAPGTTWWRSPALARPAPTAFSAPPSGCWRPPVNRRGCSWAGTTPLPYRSCTPSTGPCGNAPWPPKPPNRRSSSAARPRCCSRNPSRPADSSGGCWPPWSQRERATAAVESIRALLESETARQLTRWEEETARAEAAGDEEVLREFQEQAAVYYTAVEEITGTDLPTSSAHGALSDELIEAVEAFPLDTSRLTVTLRRDQRFGAQYALCQKRTLLGDEMGLGKTIEAIAVLAHLAAQGSKAFLIVCPAGVLINWCREIEKHSTVPVLRLYGDDREERCARWLTEGGAGVTTYETLQRLPLEGLEQLDLLIADEAHYVKNPEARRTIALTALAQKADQVLYLTGTPLENRVEEMCFLLSTLSPEIAAKAQELSDLAGAGTVPPSHCPGVSAPPPGRCAHRAARPHRGGGLV